jgi:HEAT repeat protein
MFTGLHRAAPLALFLAAIPAVAVTPAAATQPASSATSPGQAAAAALDRLGDPHSRALASALRSREWSRRAPPPPQKQTFNQPAAIEPLRLALGDPDPRVRRIAVWGLSEMRPAPEQLAPSVARLLEDPDPAVRAQAARALGEFGSRDHTARITNLLREPSARVRVEAAHALGDLQDPASRPALQAALSTPDAEVRSKVRWALRRVAEAESILRRYGRR